ncbi:SAM-dependent methyltransferase [Goodfellowiella coeruleoviolacea]|uniref:S-adenosyl methyltransferase n=1 Tax=Goodfellowiella coeruleoviolacea TaxID=334858 RepID=A0AAE3KH64_9PSEU|nr:SAM-dependent methyltransferase [Goodfellowiella coeruleoviolacea]MCP2166144.1 S-adenosyl methyltransferase [Goodfellowiella coeruleoviolacea]
MERPTWAPGEVDLSRPSIARVYDYFLGGAHNFAVDRDAAERVVAVMPQLPDVLRRNRAFLGRAVRYLVDQGVRQFLDLGSGIPTAGNVHEIAHRAAARSRVVYVDSDPVAVAHGRSILAGDDRVAVLRADAADPASVLDSAEVTTLLDLEQPVAVLLIAVLHFVPDTDDPVGIVAGYRDRLPSGSFLVITHAGFEAGEEQPEWARARDIYDSAVTPMTYRDRARFARLFTGFDLVEPGAVRIPLWRPDSPDDVDDIARHYPGYAAVGRKP